MRAFVGVGVPDEARDELARALAPALAAMPPGARLTDPRDWHLTLEFLGQVAEEQAAAIGEELRRIDLGGAFRLATAGLGAFPTASRAGVLWLGVGGDVDALRALQAAVAAACARHGHVPETRPYAPHLTLARTPRRPSVKAWIERAVEPVAIRVDRVGLYESVGGAAPKYRVRHEVELGQR